jgi:hypothetical protein
MHPRALHSDDVILPELESPLADLEGRSKLLKLQAKEMTSRAEFLEMLALRLQIVARDLRRRPL